ncbi:MAG: HD domain-containing phosphohydrolase [Phycisphaerae bacterium]
MSVRAKHISLLIAAQICCVAVGLWMQNRYVLSSVYHAAEQDAWEALAGAGDLLAVEMLGRDSTAPDLKDHSLDRVQELLGATQFETEQDAVLVDSNWRVVAQRRPSLPKSAPAVNSGQAIEWKAVPGVSNRLIHGVAGRMTTPQGDYIAIAFPVARHGGYLVVPRSTESISEGIAATEQAVPLAGIMALVWICALLGICVYMITSRFYDGVDRQLSETEAKALQHIQTLVRTRDAVIFGLAKLADSRDPETGDHLERISVYSSMLASALRSRPKYAGTMTPTFVRLIGISSALHDIGKVGIVDSILLKPGRLTDDQRKQMQRHTTIGAQCLKEIEMRLGQSNFLQMAREIAIAHHERWDGSGYPLGLAGEDIPLSARIVSIADVYDALSSRRVYKSSIPHSKCVEIIREEAGKQFDPDLIEVWLKLADQFRDVAQRYGHDDEASETGAARGSDVETDYQELLSIC